MYKRLVLGVVVIFILGCFSFLFYKVLEIKKIAYVNTTEVLLQFEGYKQGQQTYKSAYDEMQSSLDSLGKEFNVQVQAYQSSRESMTEKEQQLTEQLLTKREQEILRYKTGVEKKIKENEQKINTSVIEQINSYIKEYGEQEGYDYIFGVTDNGSILYAKEADDLTDEMLSFVNNKFEGEE